MTALPAERPPTTRSRHRRGGSRVAAPATTFAAAGVPAPLVAALAETGITTPFPIQALTLPDALAGLDILGRGQTGSGKTLSFSIPLAARLADGYTSACRPRGLVLVPTRELARQVQAVLAPLAQAVGLSVVAIYGGVPQNPQVARLRDRADIVVACPGRLADLIEQGHCHLGDVEISVIDEADHMADLGFLPVVRRLLDMTPPEGERMLFSATLDAAVDVLARRFMNHPAHHSIGPAEAPVEMVHHLLTVTRRTERAWSQFSPAAAGGHWSSPGPSGPLTNSHVSLPRPAYQRVNCTVISPRVCGNEISPHSPPEQHGSWSPPTSPPVASTWTASTWSSMPTRRLSTRLTCTGQGGPPGEAPPGR